MRGLRASVVYGLGFRCSGFIVFAVRLVGGGWVI